MSEPLPPAAAEIDWKLVGSAVGVFLATIVTTVWGWVQGRKKSEKASATHPDNHFQIAGAVLQDNTSLRDNTQATRELRDQILLLVHVLERHVRVQDDIQESLEELVKRLDRAS
jgi:hypothetical protein